MTHTQKKINKLISSNHLYIISIAFLRLTYFQTMTSRAEQTYRKREREKKIGKRKQVNAFTSGVEASLEFTDA